KDIDMPVVPYTASNFGRHWGTALAGRHNLTLSWNEFVWAAMTMGKPGVAFLLSSGWHSLSDLVVRSHTVYANLRASSNHVEKSSLYAGLDPTEKSGVSYFMGMMAAKILGARLLDTPWLFHVSLVHALGGSVVLKAKSEPDLVGLRRNREWIVAEAKGRTWGYSSSAMRAAKLQTRQLRTINGQYPSLRVAIQASFNPRLEWAIDDPEEFDEGVPDIQFDVESAMDMYYSAPIIATEKGQSRLIGSRKFQTRELSEIGVSIGIDREVRERVLQRILLQGEKLLLLDQAAEPYQEDGFTIFADGLAISLDERWSEDRMAQDPWSRRNG
ncbi:hypothetical protein, partial [Ectothiorhodospira lacustris]